MPLLLVLILVLIAFGLLLVGFLTSSVLWAWVSVLVSAAAAVVLVVDTLQRRSAVRAGDTGGIPTTRAAADDSGAEPPTAVAARPVSRPAAERPAPGDPVTEVIPVVRHPSPPPQGRFAPASDAERTIVMPVVQPSGSPTGPSGAASGVTPSRDFSSRSVTNSDPGAATSVVPAASSGPDLVKRDGPPAAGPGDTADAAPGRGAGASPTAAGPAGPAVPPAPAMPPVEATAVVPSAGSRTGQQPTSPPPAGPVGESSVEQRPVEQAPAQPPPAPAEPAVDGRTSAEHSGSEATSVVALPAATNDPAAVSDGQASGSVQQAAVGEPPSGSATAGTAEPPIREPEEPAREEPQTSAGGEPPEEPRDEQAAAVVARLDDEVLVVDEQPRYHVPGCRALVAAPLIPLPVREAVELGFTPCGWCTPDRTLAGRHAPARS